MKKLFYLISVAILASCSAPKYTASINPKEENMLAGANSSTPSINQAGESELTASIKAVPTLTEEAKQEIKTAYLNMSKSERKELRQLLKKEVKSISQVNKKEMSVTAVQRTGFDHDLKLAAIFGAIGVVALFISGNAFYVIGAIALIIGLVFFIKWLVRQ